MPPWGNPLCERISSNTKVMVIARAVTSSWEESRRSFCCGKKGEEEDETPLGKVSFSFPLRVRDADVVTFIVKIISRRVALVAIRFLAKGPLLLAVESSNADQDWYRQLLIGAKEGVHWPKNVEFCFRGRLRVQANESCTKRNQHRGYPPLRSQSVLVYSILSPSSSATT